MPTPNCFWAIWPITMFELSPSVATTTASASSMPGLAQERQVHPVPDEELAGPVVAEPAERFLALVDDRHLPARVAQLERDRGADAAATHDDHLHASAA